MVTTAHGLNLTVGATAPQLLKNEQCSRLDTSYRTIQNKIRFTPVDNIDRNVKKANIEAMDYYVSTKTHEIEQKLLAQKLNKWILQDYPEVHASLDYTQEFGHDLPIEVVMSYNEGITDYKNVCLLDYAERSFTSYINSVNGTSRYLCMTHKETGDTGLKRIVTRYSDSYRDKIIKRMNWLMWRYGNENCCLLTLTIDPKLYNYDKFAMWSAINKKYERFIEKMKVYFKRHNRPFPKYLFGIEAMYGRPENNYMSRGNPHLHICFFDCKYFAPKSVIAKYWGQGFIKVNSTAKNETVRYPIHYITKYITETFTVNSPDNCLVQSLVWLFNKHSFDHSAGLVSPLYPKGTGEWSLDGIANIKSGLYCQIDEMIAIKDCIGSLFGGYKTPPPNYQYRSQCFDNTFLPSLSKPDNMEVA